MKIAIHHSEGSFSDRWMEYCEKNNVPYRIVNCYESDIIEQLKGCNALMWHHHQLSYKDVLMAKAILFSLEQAGIKVFPNFNTGWHFDDKVGQMYLLEAINAPLVPSYVFYTKEEALKWINETTFPKVFKLRGGAGASNVKLARNKKQAKSFVRKAFGKGFSQYDRIGSLKERVRKVKEGKGSYTDIFKGIFRLFIPTEFAKMHGREKGYVYFQEFMPNNDCDIRVIVVGNRAFAIKRMTRENDFRASGSGNIIYDKNEIDLNCIKIAFEVNRKLEAQSIAYDFVFDENFNPLIVEISYGYAVGAYDPCPGYWDSELNWHEGSFNPQEWMVKDLIKKK